MEAQTHLWLYAVNSLLQLASEQLDSVALIHGYASAPRSEPEKQIELTFHDIRNPQAQDAKFKRAIL